MLLNAQLFALSALISTLVSARPLDSREPRDIIPRAKSYAIINVDGGASTNAPPPATKTVDVVSPGPTVTQEVTTTVIEVAPAHTPTSSSSKSTSSLAASASCSSSSTSTSVSISTPTISSSTLKSSSIAAETPKPIFVTIFIPKDDGPTEYYDNGLWHTKYPIKSAEPAVATSA